MIVALMLSIIAYAAPLTLDEVLSSLDARVPELAAADAKVEQSEAKRLSATGAFDPTLGTKLGNYLGKEPRDLAELGISVQTIAGPSLSSGWRRGAGTFPAYAGEDETSPAGEMWIGAQIPLLDGLLLGQERIALWSADAKLAFTQIERTTKRIDIARKATEAYARWMAAGARLAVDTELLALAESRDAALLREVEEGARARIDWLDNQRVLQQRRNEQIKSEADLQATALRLSLYRRDEQGRPLVPASDQLPPFSADPLVSTPMTVDANDTPAVRAFTPLLDAAIAEWRGARNTLLPDLDASIEASYDPLLREEIVLGAELKIAPLLRKERGKVEENRAIIDALRAEQQAVRDRMTAEIEAAKIAAAATEERLRGAIAAQEAADEVLTLEQRRVALGGTDLFQLLVRESTDAAARRSAIDAWTDHQLALAHYQALTATR